MPPELIGVAVDAGVNTLNGITGFINSERQRNWSEKMMEKQNQFSLDMWNRTNEYNNPKNQIERLRNAGLNPMYYGLDGSSANSFESAQPLQYQQSQMPLIGNPIESIEKIADIENRKADTAYKSNLALSEVERRQNLIKERDVMDSNIKRNTAAANLSDAEREKIDTFQKYADAYYQSQIELNESASELNDARKKEIMDLLPGKLEIQKMQKQDFIEKWKVWSAQIDHMFAQDKVLAKEAKYYLLGLLSNGMYGSGMSSNNALVWSYIAEDSDLTPQEQRIIEDSVKSEPSEKKRTRFRDSADAQGNFFGPTF